ncbi:hypothetical protein F2Q68_00007750 [Brassica cretica]|uniref:Uncharacterized protein n=1 Tax=Brassica cretica TaxID=69181 RepID=A0A8S9KVH3_BRACR|nr:hypothetical protein F2Q68_00007750 [Brassica cretica]
MVVSHKKKKRSVTLEDLNGVTAIPDDDRRAAALKWELVLRVEDDYHVEDESSVRDRPLKRYSSVHEWILVENLCGDPHGYPVTRYTLESRVQTLPSCGMCLGSPLVVTFIHSGSVWFVNANVNRSVLYQVEDDYHVEDESSVRDRPLKRYSSVHEWILVENLCGDPHGYPVTRYTLESRVQTLPSCGMCLGSPLVVTFIHSGSVWFVNANVNRSGFFWWRQDKSVPNTHRIPLSYAQTNLLLSESIFDVVILTSRRSDLAFVRFQLSKHQLLLLSRSATSIVFVCPLELCGYVRRGWTDQQHFDRRPSRLGEASFGSEHKIVRPFLCVRAVLQHNITTKTNVRTHQIKRKYPGHRDKVSQY